MKLAEALLQRRELPPHQVEGCHIGIEAADQDVVLLQADAAATAQDAVHLAQNLERIGHVLEKISAVDEIEVAISERQGMGVAAEEVGVCRTPAARGQLLCCVLDPDDSS